MAPLSIPFNSDEFLATGSLWGDPAYATGDLGFQDSGTLEAAHQLPRWLCVTGPRDRQCLGLDARLVDGSHGCGTMGMRMLPYSYHPMMPAMTVHCLACLAFQLKSWDCRMTHPINSFRSLSTNRRGPAEPQSSLHLLVGGMMSNKLRLWQRIRPINRIATSCCNC